ncbi:MAG: hypothetical protein Q8P31_10475 [Bacillota bacterium]|nr:hypothetical protein [Bacillota bacterium]
MKSPRVDRWHVELASRVTMVLDRIPAHQKARILQALHELSAGPLQRRCRKLRGRPEWRLRIGGRRALFLVDFEARSIVVVDIYRMVEA